MKIKKTVFFGTGGVAKAYCHNTGTLPDLFVDNDKNKWGKYFKGIKIYNPEILSEIQIEKIIITSSFLKDIKPQIIRLGVPEKLIIEPSKSAGSLKLFQKESVRFEAAKKLNSIMNLMSDFCKLVAVGGSALGFVRDKDFIYWDDDIDIFAPLDCRDSCIDALVSCGFQLEDVPDSLMQSVVTGISINDELVVPVSIDFFNSDEETFLDSFEDYSWEWPTSMFTNPYSVDVHGFALNVPNPPDEYLSKVYGNSWAIPNPEFGYSDYNGEINS